VTAHSELFRSRVPLLEVWDALESRRSKSSSNAAVFGDAWLLGFDVAERTISRCMRRAPRDPEPAKRWLAFLENHWEAVAAMDFFTVPTVTFRLYWFGHSLHYGLSAPPTASQSSVPGVAGETQTML